MNIRLTLLFCLFSMVAVAQTRYLDEVFESTSSTTHTYAVVDGEELMLDVHQPKGDTEKNRPVLIWMHGGGFSGGDRAHPDEVRLMETMAKRGYVSVTISYRLLRKGEATGFGCDCPHDEKIHVFREASRDLWEAIKFIYDNNEQFGIDRDRMIIGGSSAGAEGMLNAVFSRDYLYPPDNPYMEIKPAGAWSLAGAVIDARYINAENAIPSVFFHGTDDNLVPYATAPHHYCKSDRAGYIILDGAQTIANRLDELNESYLLYTVNGGRHEWSRIPFAQMDFVLDFFYRTVVNDETVQLKITK